MNVEKSKVYQKGKKLLGNIFEKGSKKRIFCVEIVFLIYLFWCIFMKNKVHAETEPLKKLFLLNGILILGLMVKIKISDKIKGYLAAALFLVTPAYCVGTIEMLHDNAVSQMKFLFVFLNYFLILTVFFLLYFLTNRLSWTIAIGSGIFIFYGLLYSFIKEFRGIGIRAADIYAIQTAANVAEGYILNFTAKRVKVILGAIFLIICSFYISYKNKKKRQTYNRCSEFMFYYNFIIFGIK